MLVGARSHRVRCILVMLRGELRARVSADVDDAADRAADHVRPADGDLSATCSGSICSYYDRNPVGRLMTRVTTDVDVLNDLFTSGVVTIFGDVFTLAGIMVVMLSDELAAGAGDLRGAAAHRRSSRSGSGATCASRTASCAAGSRASTRSCRRTSRACRRCSCSAARRVNFERFDDIDRDAPRRQHRLDLLLRRVLPGDRADRCAGGGADHLVRRAAGRAVGARLTFGVARRVPAVLQRGSSGRSATCRRSSTCCRRRWPPRSGSSRCSTTPVAVTPHRSAGRSLPRRRAGTSCSTTSGSPTHRRERLGAARTSSFEVQARASASGIVGATGSGKTTLINLLLRFYDVQQRTHHRRRRRHPQLGSGDGPRSCSRLVLQDVHLFSGTIADNIRLGDATSIDDAVRTRGRAVRARPPLHRAAAGAATTAPVAERGAHAVGRAEAAAVVRARPGVRSARADPRRGDVERGHRDRAAHPRRARRADGTAARRSPSRTGCRRSRTWTRSWCCTRASLRESGTHQQLLAQRGDLPPAVPAAVQIPSESA